MTTHTIATGDTYRAGNGKAVHIATRVWTDSVGSGVYSRCAGGTTRNPTPAPGSAVTCKTCAKVVR